MNKKINIKQFIYSGILYNIKVGMTRHEIISLIGIPDWFGLGNESSYMTSDMWTYGNIELYFNYEIPGKDKLGMIFTDNTR